MHTGVTHDTSVAFHVQFNVAAALTQPASFTYDSHGNASRDEHIVAVIYGRHSLPHKVPVRERTTLPASMLNMPTWPVVSVGTCSSTLAMTKQ